jgi:DNA-binding NarL/FixJ family response regulator
MIVDAEPLVREGLDSLIAGEPDLVACGHAASCAEALGLADAARPELIVLAICLKDGSGLRLIKRIKARNASVRFLVVSQHAEDLFAERALRAGALGFVGKHEPTEKIIDAIHRVGAGQLYLSEHIAERMLNGLVAGPAKHSPVETFTDRELQVFDLIRQGHSTHQMAALLHVSGKTVQTYRGRIRIKLKIARGGKLADHAARWALRSGPERRRS